MSSTRTGTPPTDRRPRRPTLPRPTAAGTRLRGRLERLRPARRRAAMAVGAGLVAAMTTVAALSVALTDRSALRPSVEPDIAVPQATGPLVRSELPGDQRVLALDRSSISLPVVIGSVVEVVGLRPTVTDVRAEVITPRAEVVGVTDEAVLLLVGVEAAHIATEVEAVGRITILGRGKPAGREP